MEIAIVTEGIPQLRLDLQPFYRFREKLEGDGFRIRVFRATELEVFRRPFDAMMVYAWQDWRNRRLFDPYQIMPLMEEMAVYRSAFPRTRQIILNHTDMSRRPYATPFWRAGDPVLYRTPAYDRRELAPFPAESIWAYENVWGSDAYRPTGPCKYKAGFIGKPTGPKGFRESVAKYTRKVGIGRCSAKLKYSKAQHDRLMSRCQIVVCPRGWGQQSRRHWDAWLSGKPVLTDRECDSVEMIPGLRLEHGEHYLVFDEPAQIPELVREWTDPSRRKQLEQIGVNGREAALSYDAYGRMRDFFQWVFASR
jgi:hypothetical protein